jgi:thiopeptide-type bacteriocin biosynthesis protein
MLPHPTIKNPISISGDPCFVDHGFCFFRVPSLPVNYLSQLHTIHNSRTEKNNLFAHPLFLEALYLGSPELYAQYCKYLDGASLSERIVQKLFRGLERYFIRMCSRCTPYGLFAGYKVGRTGTTTNVTLGSIAEHRRHLHLDLHFLTRLSRYLQALPEVRTMIRYFPNNSLYSADGRLRYVETGATGQAGGNRISAVDASPYIDSILASAQEGARVHELAACIVSEEIDEATAQAFIETLIENQLLVSELEPAPSGTDVFADLLDKLGFLPANGIVRLNLEAVGRLLQEPKAAKAEQEEVMRLLKEIFPATEGPRLTYMDLERRGGEAVINERVVREIQANLDRLWPIFRQRVNDRLRRWKLDFIDKFGDGEVPLMIALDPELGIEYGSAEKKVGVETPLLDNLALEGVPAATEFSWSRLLKWKNRKLKEALMKREAFVITDEDIAKVGFYDLGFRLPDNAFTMGSLLAASGAAVDRGEYVFALDTCFGPGSIALMTRFANGDAAFIQKLRESVAREEAAQPNAIFAEVVHVPEARGANIVLRPPLRRYEIAYLARPAVGAEDQIAADDLFVSCVEGRIVLKSKRLMKEIIPRMTASHNFAGSDLPLYKFLCDMQTQDSNTGIAWDWEIFREDAYLPRVMYRNILLRPAIWNIDYENFSFPEPAGGTISWEQLFSIYGRMRQEWGIPAKVVIADDDQKLYIDLEDETYLRLFHHHFQQHHQLELQEFLFDADNCPVTGAEGKYAHEVIIPMSRITKPEPRPVVSMRPRRENTIRQNFPPGSEWLFLKIYCSEAMAERLLREQIGPFTEELKRDGLIQKWYFIRYDDPKPHLRLRLFHSGNPSFWATIMERVNGLVEEGVLGAGTVIQYDTYERELARYHHEQIPFSETLFQYDSEAAVEIAQLLDGVEGETLRWQAALRNVDCLLNDLGLDVPGKDRLMESLKGDYRQEFKINREGTAELDQLYRSQGKAIAALLEEAKDDENGIGELAEIFARRSARNRPVIEELIRAGGSLSHAFIASHVHMALNRMLVALHRKQELVLYHLLSRHYASQIGFMRYNQ